jgi:hypothetical protein
VFDLKKWINGLGGGQPAPQKRAPSKASPVLGDNLANPFALPKPVQSTPQARQQTQNYVDNIVKLPAKVADNTIGALYRTGGVLREEATRLPARISEAFNPNDAESQADALLNQASAKYRFTNDFKNRVHKANPIIGDSSHGNARADIDIAGSRTGDDLHRILISRKATNQAETLRHEGLHDVYPTLRESQRSTFLDLVNRAAKDRETIWNAPDANKTQTVKQLGLRSFLDSKLRNYQSANGQFTDARQLPVDLQSEAHSYIPEYFETSGAQMPDYLANYYANYYDTGGKATGLAKQSAMEEFMSRIFR